MTVGSEKACMFLEGLTQADQTPDADRGLHDLLAHLPEMIRTEIGQVGPRFVRPEVLNRIQLGRIIRWNPRSTSSRSSDIGFQWPFSASRPTTAAGSAPTSGAPPRSRDRPPGPSLVAVPRATGRWSGAIAPMKGSAIVESSSPPSRCSRRGSELASMKIITPASLALKGNTPAERLCEASDFGRSASAESRLTIHRTRMNYLFGNIAYGGS